MKGKLILEDGSEFLGESFGDQKSTAGEVVFSTGMVGYPQSLTDPSYYGQILILTYPLIGNYGVPEKGFFESDKIQIKGLIVSNYIDTPSHPQSRMTLKKWLLAEQTPALEIKDTRLLTQKIREKGTMLGKIVIENDVPFYDPNKDNLVAKASTKKIIIEGKGSKTVLLFDCGAKRNIIRCLLERGMRVITVPWDFDPFDTKTNLRGRQGKDLVGRKLIGRKLNFDAVVISNGPGDPKMATKTIETIRETLSRKIPVLGICLGHQLLALAGGGDTKKLKFGHRSQNQPCILEETKRCFITTQNHGFAVTKIPKGFKPWFTNANDQSNEGIIHKKLPFMSVQFHPEATPGPTDTEWIFDYFLEKL
ncbi:MAG: glutamine-hydrolyzing carbamoyl-phosphate synthase small subunit [Candidatus Levybacteria bacterium]|nr:glutamine-hydrolyzing carbamoyl-phosphate synthase small subunit [Candidatus Levybacteria bacterium]